MVGLRRCAVARLRPQFASSMKAKREREDGDKAIKSKKRKTAVATAPSGKGAQLEDMSVDDFLGGGFLAAAADAPETGKPAGKKSKRTRAEQAGLAEASQPAAKQASKRRRPKQQESAPAATAPAAKAKAKAKAKPEAKQESAPELEADPAESGKGGRRTARSEHKSQLEALKEKDPEFFKYLQETDKALLEFGDSESDEDEEPEEAEEQEEADESEEESDEEAGADGADAQAAAQAAAAKAEALPEGARPAGILTHAMVDKWCTEAKAAGSLGAFERLIKAYRVACHLGDSEEDMAATMRIVSSAVFNKVLVFMVKEADGLLRRHLKLPAGPITPDQVKKAPRWKKLEAAAKSFLGNSLHLLGAPLSPPTACSQLKEEGMVVFMLRHLRQSTAFLIVSDRLRRKYLKLLLGQFGSGGSGARVQAILFLRQMALLLPAPTMSLTMKGVYRAFVVNAKFMSAASAAHIDFMATCVVEIFGLDSAAAYEHGFTLVRQLAVLLRGALSQKSRDAFRQVYCWQTVNALELWARLLATHADKPDLRALVYPLVQIITGAIRLVPTPRYFPLRLRLARALIRLGAATGEFVPVAPLLLEMLQWRGLHTAVKAAAAAGPAAAAAATAPQLRAGKQLLATAAFQQSLVDEVLLLLAEHFAQWATHAAFPEMAHTVLLQLRKMSKDARVERFRTTAAGLVAALQANAAWVLRHRAGLECSPKDAAALAAFLSSDADRQQAPMRKYAKSLADRAARQRRLAGAEAVTVPGGAAAAADESDDEAAAAALPDMDLLLKLREKAGGKGPSTRAGDDEGEGQGDGAEEADSSGDEEQGDLDFGAEQEDIVRNFELSDSEGEEEEEEEGEDS